jgi:hypothetical protein
MLVVVVFFVAITTTYSTAEIVSTKNSKNHVDFYSRIAYCAYREGNNMTIQEALKAAQEIFPDDENVYVSMDVSLYKKDKKPRQTLWVFANSLPRRTVSSNRSWEHALAIARTGNEDIWPEVEEPFEEQEAQQ